MDILIICLISLLSGLIVFLALRNEKSKIRDWLLLAVAEAEKELGTGTGQKKLKRVYARFTERFPAVSFFVAFETFSGWVDAALCLTEKILECKEGNNAKN